MIARLLLTPLAAAAAVGAQGPPPRVVLGTTPTNLYADFGQVFVAPGTTADEFFVLAPFSGAPADRFPFAMFAWESHPSMQSSFPAGWLEIAFAFPHWAYLSSAPCGLQPAPGNTEPWGGIDSTYGYGPISIGPVTGIHTPAPGWVLGTTYRSVSGHPTHLTTFETFALHLADFHNNPLNACAAGTPVTWIAARVRFALVPH